MPALFEKHPTPAVDISARAAALGRAALGLDDNRDAVRTAGAAAAREVSGDLRDPVTGAPEPVTEVQTALSQHARFGAGAIGAWADGVSDFDAGVDRLNAELVTLLLNPARLQVRYPEMRTEYGRLESTLDDRATDVAGMLERGPNDADLAELRALGVLPETDPFTDPDLLSALGKPGSSALSPDAHTTAEEAAWWASLTAAEQQAVLTAYPLRVGNVDGVPAWIRDQSNRGALERDLAELTVLEHRGELTDEQARALDGMRAMQDSLGRIEGTTDPLTGQHLGAQLYAYEPYAFDGEGRAAIATGDLDTAEHTAVMVPGLGTTAAGITGNRALNVYRESREASGDSVAVLDWVGYDAPSGGLGDDVTGVVDEAMARDGAAMLAADVDGLHQINGSTHLTVAGNSYGSTVTALAADNEDLAADDVILTGSPGAGDADDADDFTTGRDHTWVASASTDFVTSLGVTGWADPSQVAADVVGIDPDLLGNDPSEDDFEAQRIQAESTERGGGWNLDDHSRYYDDATESLYNISAIVTGDYDSVLLAEHRYDPWYDSLQDPEGDRDPTVQDHG